MTRFATNDPCAPEAEARLRSLRRSTWRELLELPMHSQLEVSCSERRAIISVYRDLLPEERIRIVVQVYVPGRLGSARVSADGFVATMNEERLELQDEDLYEFT